MYAHVLRTPVKSLETVKKQKIMRNTIITLLEACIVSGVAATIASMKTVDIYSAASAGVSMLGILLIASVISAFVLETIMHTLDGKGKYYEALTAVSFSATPLSAGLLAGSLMLYVPSAGPLLAFIFLLPMTALSIALLYKSIKELFAVDAIISYMAVTVFVVSQFISLYALAALSLLSGIGAII